MGRNLTSGTTANVLIVRPQQMSALVDARLSAFKSRLAVHITEVLPEQAAALGPAGLEAAIDRHVPEAMALGLESEHDLARYVDLAVTLGPAWRGDWTAPILADSNLTPSDRITEIFIQLPLHVKGSQALSEWWAA